MITKVMVNQERMEMATDDVCRMVSSLSMDQSSMQASVMSIKHSMDNLRDSVDSLTVLNIMSGNIDVETHASSAATRAMSTTVLASLIRGLWYDANPTTAFPVAFKYMKSLCDSVMESFPNNTKSAMGASLSRYIEMAENIPDIHNSMLMVICNADDSHACETRHKVIKMIAVLGTHLSFV